MSETIPLSRVSTPTPAAPRSGSGYAPIQPDTASPSRYEFPSGISFDTIDEAKQIHPLWKRELYVLLEQPTSSQAAFLVHILTTSLIILSAIVTVLETVPSFHSIPGGIWFGVETALVVLFTVEYIARCIGHSGSWKMLAKWVMSFFGVIDLLGILPYYIEIALHQDTSILFRFTILRTFRLLRVFRPFRHNNMLLLTIEVMYLSFRRSQHALLALAFFVVMVLVVFSTLLYFAERGTWDESLGIFINTDGDPSQFASIPAAAWFVIVTITTVGYGEITPRSFLGRLITLPLLVFGLLLIALPTFVLGREFSSIWDTMKEDQRTPQIDEDLNPLTSPILSRNRDAMRSMADIRLNPSMTPDWRARQQPQQMGATSSAVPNNADLHAQIAELKMAMGRQEEMMQRLLYAMERKGKRRANGSAHQQQAGEDSS